MTLMKTKKIEMANAERKLIRMSASENKDRMRIHVELVKEPFLTELCEALLKYILLGEVTNFDSRVMRGLYEHAIEIFQKKDEDDDESDDDDEWTDDAEEGVNYAN